jgi:hypothetical protein
MRKASFFFHLKVPDVSQGLFFFILSRGAEMVCSCFRLHGMHGRSSANLSTNGGSMFSCKHKPSLPFSTLEYSALPHANNISFFIMDKTLL